MRWRILVESSPNNFTDAGLDIYDDGFPIDGSGWGQEESDTIQAKLGELWEADEHHRSYAATWVGLEEGLRVAVATKRAIPHFITWNGKKPKKHK